MLLLCTVRKWNQTGNKWLHMPDVSDYLNRYASIRGSLLGRAFGYGSDDPGGPGSIAGLCATSCFLSLYSVGDVRHRS